MPLKSRQTAGKNVGSRPELDFVESVKVRRVGSRISRRQRLLIWFWGLMTVKCVLAHWAIIAWEVPIGPFYIWMPSMAAAAVCTVAFLYCE